MSQKDKLDSDAEASAVIAALRAENEKASKLKNEAGSRKAPDTPQVWVLSDVTIYGNKN